MKILRKIRINLQSLTEQLILKLSGLLKIDILDLAYRQRELCLCDVGEKEFLHYSLKEMLADCPHPLFIDVGANQGDYSAWLTEAFPYAAVHGFEPNPETFQLYLRRFAGNNQVTAHQFGLSNVIGLSTIYTYSSHHTSGHASLEVSVFSGTNRSVDSLPCHIETLDHLVDDIPELAKPSFIKLDIEGFERHALEGATGVLSNKLLKAVQFEFNSMNIHTRSYLKDFYQILGDEFQFFRLNSRGMEPLGDYSTKNEIFTYQNIVAVRKEWAHFCPRHWPKRNSTIFGKSATAINCIGSSL